MQQRANEECLDENPTLNSEMFEETMKKFCNQMKLEFSSMLGRKQEMKNEQLSKEIKRLKRIEHQLKEGLKGKDIRIAVMRGHADASRDKIQDLTRMLHDRNSNNAMLLNALEEGAKVNEEKFTSLSGETKREFTRVLDSVTSLRKCVEECTSRDSFYSEKISWDLEVVKKLCNEDRTSDLVDDLHDIHRLLVEMSSHNVSENIDSLSKRLDELETSQMDKFQDFAENLAKMLQSTDLLSACLDENKAVTKDCLSSLGEVKVGLNNLSLEKILGHLEERYLHQPAVSDVLDLLHIVNTSVQDIKTVYWIGL